jgi:hypothetical protein
MLQTVALPEREQVAIEPVAAGAVPVDVLRAGAAEADAEIRTGGQSGAGSHAVEVPHPQGGGATDARQQLPAHGQRRADLRRGERGDAGDLMPGGGEASGELDEEGLHTGAADDLMMHQRQLHAPLFVFASASASASNMRL